MTKKLTTALIIASFCLPPAVAFAQAPPGGPPPGGPPGMGGQHGDFSKMRQVHEQMAQIERTERDAVLGALTPAHRELLARSIGELSVAQKPDPRAAAARLDAALTPGEKSAILSAHQTAMTQMHDVLSQAMKDQNHPRMQHERKHTPTAGEIAMRVAGHGDHDMMFMHPGGPMQHKPPQS